MPCHVMRVHPSIYSYTVVEQPKDKRQKTGRPLQPLNASRGRSVQEHSRIILCYSSTVLLPALPGGMVRGLQLEHPWYNPC